MVYDNTSCRDKPSNRSRTDLPRTCEAVRNEVQSEQQQAQT